MLPRNSLKMFCEAYYQLQDTLDENNDKLYAIKEECNTPLEKTYNSLEETLESERDKILQINYSKYNDLSLTKKKRILEKIKKMTETQNKISERINNLMEENSQKTNSSLYSEKSNANFKTSDMSEKYKRFSQSFKSGESVISKSENLFEIVLGGTGAESLCMEELPESYCRLTRL